MKSFWDERFSQEEYVYGTQPNRFFEKVLSVLPPGKLLLPGEGEGRNAVFAATQGWQVDAFDSSVEGKRKALLLAERFQANIHYTISTYEAFNLEPASYDAVGLIFTHCDPIVRRSLHQKIVHALRPDGVVILEAFSRNQLGKKSGGPQKAEMLFSLEELKGDFAGLTIDHLEEVEVNLNEGLFHQGKACIVRISARKAN